MAEIIYMDHAATTPLSHNALTAMLPFLKNEFGNPSAVYSIGRNARRAVDAAREKVATVIGANPQEIYFTSGGTESDNWALHTALQRKKGHIISTQIEHHAVLHTLKYLRSQGFEATLLEPDEYGQISPKTVEDAIRPDTILISVMAANNEIGTILPIPEIAEVARRYGIKFHTDAVQAAGHIPIDVKEWGIDMLSLSGHKFGGPKGVGVFYARRGSNVDAIIHGGAQERGMRAGTENVAGIVGLAAALEESVVRIEADEKCIAAMRDDLISQLSKIQGAKLTGHPINRLPGIVSFIFDGIEGEDLLLLLDQAGICASAGSACAAGAVEPSHVLTAIGLSQTQAHSALRLSLGACNTADEIEYVVDKLSAITQRIRKKT